jgi:hypothetical protein
MAAQPKVFYPAGGINTYSNPLELGLDGIMIHSVNMTSFPMNAKSKRTGYSTFLGTADGQQVNSLLDYHRNDGTQFWLYRASGSALRYSAQGTGEWTTAGNGTIQNGGHFGAAILDNVMIGGDGVGSTRHTTNGTSFTNTSLAPIAEHFEEYQNRIYAAGTSSNLFYSTTNDGTNWNTSGTSDSSSFVVPGAGKLGKIFKAADKLVTTKNSGLMHKWDGFSVLDMTTQYGPFSPYSVANTEDYRFFVNQLGVFGFGGAKPQLISNAIQRQFYNDSNTGIAGTAFPTIPAVCHRYDYLASVGTITDDFTDRRIDNAIIKYDYQKNEFLNWSFADKPTAFLSYKDTNFTQQLIFGDANGQCYKLDNSTTDNGVAIPSEMVFVYHYGNPFLRKKWNWYYLIFNPGCQAKVQVSYADTYQYQYLTWEDIGDCSNGITSGRFPNAKNSNFLFVRVYESSKDARYTFYGLGVDAEFQPT